MTMYLSVEGIPQCASDDATPVKNIADTKRYTPVTCGESSGSHRCSTDPAERHDESKDEDIDVEEMLRNDRTYSVPEVGIDGFANYLLPPLRDGIDLNGVLSSLKEEGLISSKGQWRHFEARPAEREEGEDIVFAPLAEIYDKSIHYASSGAKLEPTFRLTLPPNRPSDSRSDVARPDGYFILKEADDRAQFASDRRDRVRWWYDIALTAEFKKERTYEDLDDNVSQVVFNMQQTMTLDPCRRFTFGITIEDTSMRLWFVSRSTVVISNAFNFTSEVELLTRVFLSFAFASKEELGWDPTIQPFIGNDGKRQYRIDVGDESFETKELLSDLAVVDTLASRATRVWRVRHASSGEPCVLKDVWPEENQPLEHVTYGMILRDVETKYGAEIRREVASHLLTPVAHWLVTVHGEEDHTTWVMMRGYEPDVKHDIRIKVLYPNYGGTSSYDECARTSDAELKPITPDVRAPFPQFVRRRKIVRRRHYRIVFKEVADSLDAVAYLHDAFTVLRDSVKVLKWIHGCGWVHRDISIGNLYLYAGRGMIGDLEYAKRRGSDALHEQRFGTPGFIAVEAEARYYMSIPPKGVEEPVSVILARILAKNEEHSTEPEVHPPFCHNDLHDLESLWWVTIWLFFFRQCESERNLQTDERDMQRRIASSQLFRATSSYRKRRDVLWNNSRFIEKTAWMTGTISKYRTILNSLRATLALNYEDVESEYPAIRLEVLQETYNRFQTVFDTCRDFSVGVRVEPYRVNASHQLRSTVTLNRTFHEHTVETAHLPPPNDEVNKASMYEVDANVPGTELVPVMHMAPRVWRCSKLAEVDCFTPVPLLRVVRFELEVW